MSLHLIAYFNFFVYLKFDYFEWNYSIVLKQFHHFLEFFFLMTQVFFEFDLDYLKECYLAWYLDLCYSNFTNAIINASQIIIANMKQGLNFSCSKALAYLNAKASVIKYC